MDNIMEIESPIIGTITLKHQIEKLLLSRTEQFSELLNKPSFNKLIMVDIEDVKDIISSEDWDDGIYGFLNYQLDLKYDIFKMNKYSCKKPLSESDFDNLIKQNYGFLELFSKTNNEIISLNKYNLIKDANINYINDTDFKNIKVEELSEDFIITKIYKIEQKKIVHITNMTKKEYILEDNKNDMFVNYRDRMMELYTNDKKMLDYVFNFEHIEKLKKIINKNIDLYDVDDIMIFDFSNIINNIKVSNRYDINEYNRLINKYFGFEYDSLFEEGELFSNSLSIGKSLLKSGVLNKYNIHNLIKDALRTVLEILMRLYIDIKLNHKTYCLNKRLISYIPLEDDMYLQSKDTLIRRYCKKILLSSNINDIIVLILQMLKKHNLSYIIEYIDSCIL